MRKIFTEDTLVMILGTCIVIFFIGVTIVFVIAVIKFIGFSFFT